MSSNTPILDERTAPYDGKPTARVSPRLLAELDASSTFTARRSPLIAWTVRVAQLADRFSRGKSPAAKLAANLPENLVERTLDRLEQYGRLLPMQPGVVAAERVWVSMDKVLQQRRKRFARFCELRQRQQTLDRYRSYLHLNPVCRWVRQSDMLATLPVGTSAGSVLFFLGDKEVRGLCMTLEGQALINELADYQPCTVFQWSELSALTDIEQLECLAVRLAEMGLISWGTE